MKFYKTEHTTFTRKGDECVEITLPKELPQEAQIFNVEWTDKKVIATWWIPDRIMPVGGFTEKS